MPRNPLQPSPPLPYSQNHNADHELEQDVGDSHQAQPMKPPAQKKVSVHGRCHGPGQSAAGAGETGQIFENADIGDEETSEGYSGRFVLREIEQECPQEETKTG